MTTRKAKTIYDKAFKESIIQQIIENPENRRTICRENGINPSITYPWTKGMVQTVDKPKRSKTPAVEIDELSRLRAENIKLKRVVASLTDIVIN